MSLAHIEDLGDRIVIINTNAGRRNPLSEEYYAAMRQGLTLAAEPRITSVILWAEGFFCSGGDLNNLAARRDAPDAERREAIGAFHDVIRAIRDCRKPVIAAVEGGAAGAGASIAFACDFIIAAQGSNFTAAYVKAGLVPDGGLTASLSAILPRALVCEMLLLGAPIEAQRLADLAAITQICPPGEARSAAMMLADRLAKGPTATQERIKSLIASAQENSFHAQLDEECDAMAHAIGSPEAREGIEAFFNRTPPDFIKLRSK